MASNYPQSRGTDRPPEYRESFKTKEGVYHNIKSSTYCRPTKAPYFSKLSLPVNLSLVHARGPNAKGWIAFNVGKELYCYEQCKTGQQLDLNRPVDKHTYKGTVMPVSHDFNQMTAGNNHLDLLVGFTNGAVQHLNPLRKEEQAVFNDDGSIDNTHVMCIKWVPGSESMFVTGHRSGYLYLWEIECKHKVHGSKLQFVFIKETQDTKFYTCKSKHKCQVLERWSVGHGSINGMAFSPDCTHLAVVSQDGFLRVYNFKMHELYGRMRSYFGALLCVCWSPDGNYVVTGGEDDLVNVWSFHHSRIITRGEGHKSWINAVAFDPYTSSAACESTDEKAQEDVRPRTSSVPKQVAEERKLGVISYRFASVGQDTHLLLWELSGDALKLRRPFTRLRSYRRDSKFLADQSDVRLTEENSTKEFLSVPGSSSLPRSEEPSKALQENSYVDGQSPDSQLDKQGSTPTASTTDTHSHTDNASESTKGRSVSPNPDKSSGGVKTKKNRHHKEKKLPKKLRNMFTSPNHHSRVSSASGSYGEFSYSDDIAPKMSEVNVMEPLVNKKIWSERLTGLYFREDFLYVATHDGFIQCWTRPDGSERSTSPDSASVNNSSDPSLQATIKDTAPQDPVPQDTIPQETTAQDTAPQDTAPQDTAPQDTTAQDIISQGMTPQDIALQDIVPQASPNDDSSVSRLV